MSSLQRPNPLESKCERIHAAGLETLRSGKINLFTGFPQQMRSRFNVSVLFDGPSQLQFEERIIRPLGTISKELGLDWYLASDAFSVHSTVLECETEVGHADVEGLVKKIDLNQLLCERLVFSELLLDKSNLLLNSLEIPPIHHLMRNNLAEFFTGVGHPLPLEDILHITVGRLMKLNEPDVLREYVERMLVFRASIKKDPLTLIVGGVYCGSALKLVAPQSI